MPSDLGIEEPAATNPSCASFWGPIRPVFGGHTLEQAGTSLFLPVKLVALWRLCFSIFLTVTVVYYLVEGRYQLQFYSVWSHLGLAAAFIAATLASICIAIKPEAAPALHVSASAVVAIFQVFATAAFFLDVVYWAILFDYSSPPQFPQLAQHAFNLIFVFVDMFLTLQMDFRLIYAVLAILFTLVYLAFVWVRYSVTNTFVYDFLDFRNKNVGVVVGTYIGVFAWGVLAAAGMLVLSRIGRFVSARKDNRDNSFEEDEAVAL